MMKNKFSVLLFATLLLLQFQNCSKIAISDLTNSDKNTTSDNNNGQGDPNPNPNPQPPPDPRQPRDVSQRARLRADESPLDLILVIDNSGSMRTDSEHLAGKLEGFLKTLKKSSIDWQMCYTDTRYHTSKGEPHVWHDTGTKILSSRIPRLNRVLRQTVEAMDFSGGGERGIAALRGNLESRNTHDCYRRGSVVSTIVITDEDEASVGDRWSLYNSMYGADVVSGQQSAPMAEIDKPDNYVAKFKKDLPENELVSNSIIIKPEDNDCLINQQNEEKRQDPSKGIIPVFFGFQYANLSAMTKGAVGSICAPDYTPVLSDIASAITKHFRDVELECAPIDGKVTVKPSEGLTWTVAGDVVKFQAELPRDLDIVLDYQCAAD